MKPELFKAEVQRRLIDTWDLMILLNLRSKQAVWARVKAGKLPTPALNKPNTVAFWDRDELKPYLDGKVG